MADTYLPADVRKRIVDVMRERKMTQRELALRIDMNENTRCTPSPERNSEAFPPVDKQSKVHGKADIG